MGLWTERHLWIAREAAGSSTNRGKTCRRLRRSAGSNGGGHWCPPGHGQRSLVHAAWLRRSQHGYKIRFDLHPLWTWLLAQHTEPRMLEALHADVNRTYDGYGPRDGPLDGVAVVRAEELLE